MLVTVFAFFFFTFDSQYQLDHALDQFLKGQQEQALDSLGYLDKEVRPSRLALYKAYVLREQGRLKEANAELERALNAAARAPQSDIFYEVCLNRAFNAFLEDDLTSFNVYLEQARLKEPDLRLSIFFQGLANYLEQDYAKALENWAKTPSFDYLSRWMEHAFSEQFSEEWRVLRLAHCYIEQGQFLLARDLLEKGHEDLSGERRLESAFLIGLSYATEAQEKPLAAAMPYYQVAQSYFDQLPIHHESFATQKERLSQQLSEAAAIFIRERDFENVSFFVNILEHWKANDALNSLSKAILLYLEEQITQQSWDEIEKIASILNKLLKDGYIRQAVSTRFEGFINELLKKGDFEQLANCWQVSLLLSSNPADLIEETSAQIASQVLAQLETDQDSLEKTAPYLSYWSSVERDGHKRFLFARQLLLLAAQWWPEKGKETKALNLMKLAQNVPFITEREKIQSLIEQELKNIYLIAAQEDNIEKLSYLHDAARFFRIESFGKQETTEISAQLEDAAYLNRMGRFLEAQKRLEWIVKVKPDSQEALRLLAQVLYRQGIYDQALAYFERLSEKDKEVQEKMGVSKLLGEQMQQGQRELEKLARQKPLADFTYLQLGYVSLLQKDGKKALDWFSQMNQMTVEAKLLASLAAFQSRDYQLSLDRFHQLPAPYAQNQQLLMMAVQSFVQLDRLDAAQTLIKRLLEEKSEKLPTRFGELLRNIFPQQELYEFVGDFYQDQLAAYETALSYYRKLENATTDLALKKAKALIALDQEKQAAFLLKPLAGNDKRAALLLAELYLKQYQFDQAGKIYQKFDKELEQKDSMRAAKAAMALRKWKVAAKFFQAITALRDLSDDENVLYLQTLVMANQKALATQTLNQTNVERFSTKNKLKLLNLVLKMGTSHLFKLLWDALPEPETMNVAEKQELLALYTEMGKYRYAKQLAAKIMQEIEQDVSGQMTLANLETHLLNVEGALKRARKALSLQAYDLEVRDFLSRFEQDPVQLQIYMQHYEKRLQEQEGHLMAELGYLDFYHCLAYKKRANGQIDDEQWLTHLRALQKTLKNLADQHKEEPEVFALLGRVLFDSQDYQAAEHALNWALQLSPSTLKAQRILAMLQQEQGQMQQAANTIEKALLYQRNDVGLWIELSHSYQILKQYQKAKYCLKQARYFSLRESRVYRALGEILKDLDVSEEKETAEKFDQNREALDNLLGLL